MRIVWGRLHLRREQFQLLRFTLFIKDLNRSQPPCLIRTVQFAQMTQCSLTRPIGCAHRLHQRPVGVLLAILRESHDLALAVDAAHPPEHVLERERVVVLHKPFEHLFSPVTTGLRRGS